MYKLVSKRNALSRSKNNLMTKPMPRVLIADDDRTLADVIRFRFAREQYDVAVAHDGKTALRRAQSEPFDVIICDFQMPYLNGEQVLTGIRAAGCSREALLILCTAKGYELEAERLKTELQLREIMLKPFSIVHMLEIAKSALSVV